MLRSRSRSRTHASSTSRLKCNHFLLAFTLISYAYVANDPFLSSFVRVAASHRASPMASCAVCLDACLGKCAVREFTSRACAADLRIANVARETIERRASTED